MIRLFLLSTSVLFFTACQSATADKVMHANGDAVERGQALYVEYCETCHGMDMTGGQAQSLVDDQWEYGGLDTDIRRFIADGIEEAAMPAFGDVLSTEQTSDLITYIRKGGKLKTTPPVDNVQSVQEQVKVETYVDDLEEPWGIAFFPGRVDDMLITEKSGHLVRFVGLNTQRLQGLPEVLDNGQGGMLDVAFDPDYDETGWVYLAFSHPVEPGSGEAMTKIIRGKIDGFNWTDEQPLFEAKPEHYIKSRVHYGGRITFDKEGYLFFSIGDRGPKEMAQDVTKPNGKIHRINRDGSIPQDNPFVGQTDAYPSIWAYGNRNPQGLIIHPDTGVLWETEHGPRGGDELNTITKGMNYGWPKISYGINYNGTVLTPHTALPGMEQPKSQWTPSIAVCGLDVYTGDLFPEWKGRLLAGSLANESLRLIEVDGDQYVSEVTLLKGKGRIRDVTTGPDGAIYVALPNKIIRVVPAP